MFCNNGAIICDQCGKFTRQDEYLDCGTPFGSAYNSYGDPEPLETEHFCQKHAEEGYVKMMKNGLYGKSGYWEKPAFEIRAAKEQGLVWDSSNYQYSTPAGPEEDHAD